MGVDFNTGDVLNEIPGAHFWRSPETDEPDFIFIPEPLPGTYTLRLLGMVSGSYQAGMDWITPEGAVVVQAFAGESVPGQVYEFTLTFDPQALPALPLTLTWLPPLQADEVLSVSRHRTLTVRFRIEDAEGNFVADERVAVWLLDPERPTEPLAVFTVNGASGERVRLLRHAEMYMLPLHLRQYDLEPGKVYLIGVQAFGQQVGVTAFQVQR